MLDYRRCCAAKLYRWRPTPQRNDNYILKLSDVIQYPSMLLANLILLSMSEPITMLIKLQDIFNTKRCKKLILSPKGFYFSQRRHPGINQIDEKHPREFERGTVLPAPRI
jgi:hypothetical protein